MKGYPPSMNSPWWGYVGIVVASAALVTALLTLIVQGTAKSAARTYRRMHEERLRDTLQEIVVFELSQSAAGEMHLEGVLGSLSRSLVGRLGALRRSRSGVRYADAMEDPAFAEAYLRDVLRLGGEDAPEGPEGEVSGGSS